jgi:predicted nucleic acid-binding protein
LTGVPCYLLDTNILLRFLRADHAEHSAASCHLFDQARNGGVTLELPFIAIVETFHTLRAFYKTEKAQAGRELLKIMNARGVRVTAPHWIDDAINEYLSRNVAFGDACIVAEARSSGRVIASFDRGFDAFDDVKRFEPK